MHSNIKDELSAQSEMVLDEPALVIVAEPAFVHEVLARVQAGFPSPAEDLGIARVDLNKILIKNPEATFVMCVRGASVRDAGIDDGDFLIVDRSINPRHRHMVVAVVDGEFTLKRLWKRGGALKLQPANSEFGDIVPQDGQTVEVWGVATYAFKSLIP